MINKSVDEAIFDTILAEAFRDAAEAELQQDEQEKSGGGVLPDALLRAEHEAYRKYKRSRGNLTVQRRMRAIGRIAACAVVLVGIVGGVMAAAPTVYAKARGLMMQLFDGYVEIEGMGSCVTLEGQVEYTLGYIPAGYKLTDTDNPGGRGVFVTYTFTHKDGDAFTLRRTPTDGTKTLYDSEHTTIEPLMINGFDAFFIEFEDWHELVWSDGSYTFMLSGTISQKEMIKIIEKISPRT